MPDSVSALAMPLPLLLVPSPGYGPPVSSGMTEQVPLLPETTSNRLPVCDQGNDAGDEVKALERQVAELPGKEAAAFMPSGAKIRR